VTLYSALEVILRYLRHSTYWLFYITLYYIWNYRTNFLLQALRQPHSVQLSSW